MSEKVKDFLKQNIGYVIVAFTSIVYVFTAFLTVDRSGKALTQIFADGAIAFFLGLFINRIFDLQGVMSGERQESVRATKEAHAEIVLRISSEIDRLDDWCHHENEKNYVLQRKKILACVGLKYEDCFDENGVAKDWHPDFQRKKDKRFSKMERKRKRGYAKAVHLKLTALSTSELTSEGTRQQDPYWLGRTKARFEAEQSVFDFLSKLGTAIIFGYYGVSLIQDFHYARLIWTTLQVALFLIMGVVSMYKSHNFIVDEFRARIIKKIDHLQKFENYVKTIEKKNMEEKEDVDTTRSECT